jgi:magnesium transporter
MPDTQIESIKTELEQLIAAKNWKVIQQRLVSWHEAEVADLIDELNKADRILVFRTLPRAQAARVFAYLDTEHQNSLIHQLTDEDTRHILANLSPDDRTALLEELPAQLTHKLMRLLNPEDLAEARQLLGYPEGSVGRLMTPDYVEVRPDMTIAEALESIRQQGRDSETLNMVYVTDENDLLLDALRLRRFITARPEQKVRDLMDNKYIALSAFDEQAKAVETIQRYDVFAIPVVDSEGYLLGIVTVDDVLDVAEEEATEDIQRGAAVTPLDRPYTLASPRFLIQRRVGWLMILVFVNLISVGVIASYEEHLGTFIALAFFMPLLIASGGNAGAQSATLVVRALATGDLELSLLGRAIGKEIIVGIGLGIVLGVLSSFLGSFRGGIEIGLIVGLSMFCIILVANLLGVILPFALTRCKLDPAMASSPLITSMMDAIGLLIYFTIAAKVLGF